MAVDDPEGRASACDGARGKIGERVRGRIELPGRRLHGVDGRRLVPAVQVDLLIRRVVAAGHLVAEAGHGRARAPRVRRDVVDQGRVVNDDRIRSSRRSTEEIDLVRRRVVDRCGDERHLRHRGQRRPRVRCRVIAVDGVQRRPDVLWEVVAAEGVDVRPVRRRRGPEQRLRQRCDVLPGTAWGGLRRPGLRCRLTDRRRRQHPNGERRERKRHGNAILHAPHLPWISLGLKPYCLKKHLNKSRSGTRKASPYCRLAANHGQPEPYVDPGRGG